MNNEIIDQVSDIVSNMKREMTMNNEIIDQVSDQVFDIVSNMKREMNAYRELLRKDVIDSENDKTEQIKKQFDLFERHSLKLSEEFTKYVDQIQTKLDEAEIKNNNINRDIINTNKLIALATIYASIRNVSPNPVDGSLSILKDFESKL